MRKAVFFDRDGVINKERGDYTYLPEDFEINEGVIQGMKELQNAGYLLFVVTNQGGIAKGIYSIIQFEFLNDLMISEFKKAGVELQEIYYCPHHESTGNCLCRKPGSILFEKAVAANKICTKSSFMIGDSDRDIIAAEKVGINGVKILPNQNIKDICKEIAETGKCSIINRNI
jgi:D-glycero-D-manno-heptose 1,7-bisphosphate phosphatase